MTSALRRAFARLTPARSTDDGTARRRRPVRTAALTATLLVLAGGSVAFADAHKTVTLDVDGETTDLTTFAGSVDGLLAEADVEVGERDVVAPGGESELRDGDEVVVRTAKQLAVLTDGEESHVWTTALDASEALASLEARGDDVRLVASRSLGDGRADLADGSLSLAGPVEVHVDGETHPVADGAAGLAAVLADLDVVVGPLDRVHVHQPNGTAAPVTVTVERVVAEEVTTTEDVAFETVRRESDDLYTGQTRVGTEGTPGERTIVERVVTVDGEEESRMLLSDTVTTQPVDEVVLVGTKARPAPRPSTSSGSGSSGSSGGGSVDLGSGVWAKLAQCESGGNPSIVSSNGLYHGLYQFSVSTWRSVGGSGLPSQASPAEQTKRAKMLQARSGWGQWPACSAKLGLR